MPSTPSALQVAQAAEFLVLSHKELTDEDNDEIWNDCEEGRARSAISRAYYSVFFRLKERLTASRSGWSFPQANVHSKLLVALERSLGPSHTLCINFKSLLQHRKKADYHISKTFTCSQAESFVDAGHDALDEVDSLDSAEVLAIANELHDIDVHGF